MHDRDPDDIDRLFARAPVRPPREIGARARARLATIRRARRLTAVALLDLLALLLLAPTAFLLGTALAQSEVPAILRLIAEDHQLAIEARRDLARALIQALPWREVLLAVLNALVVALATSGLLRATGRAVTAGGAR